MFSNEIIDIIYFKEDGISKVKMKRDHFRELVCEIAISAINLGKIPDYYGLNDDGKGFNLTEGYDRS